jgi:hypothetical protein
MKRGAGEKLFFTKHKPKFAPKKGKKHCFWGAWAERLS